MSAPLISFLFLLSYWSHDGFQPRIHGSEPSNPALTQVLPNVSYTREDLDVVLRNLSRTAAINIVVDWPALEAIGIYGDTPIDLSLRDVTAATAMASILSVADRYHRGVVFVPVNGVWTVTSEAVRDRQLDVRTYDCTALLKTGDPPPPRCHRRHHHVCLLDPRRLYQLCPCVCCKRLHLIDVMEGTIDPESWDDNGGPASVRLLGDRLVVRQTNANHAQIKRVLEELARP